MRRDAHTFPLLFLAVLLMLVGAVLPEYDQTQRYLKRVFLLAGFAGFVWTLFQSGSTLRFLLFRIRTVSEPGPALNWLFLGGLLLVAATALSMQGLRFDVTARRANSLTETSRSALSTLTQDVEMVAVFRANTPLEKRARDLLQLYRQASGRIQVRIFDPDRDPEEARRMGLTRPDVMIVQAASAREVVADLREPELTQAILRVEDVRRPVAAVVIGHGELDPERAGVARFRKLLTDAGYQYRTLPLAEFGDVPGEVSLLLVLGPRTSLLAGERQAIDRYLDRGGRLGVFADPESSTGLEEVLQQRGIVIDGRRIRDDSQLTRSLDLGPETIGLNQLGDHPVTAGLSVGVALKGATRVGLTERPIFGTDGSDLMRTGPRASLLGSRPGQEGATAMPPSAGSAPGPEDSLATETATPPAVIPVAAALQWEVTAEHGRSSSGHAVPEKPYARVVAIGDSDFLRDGMIDLFGNREFAARIVSWLGEREFLLFFPQESAGATRLRVNQAGLKAVDYLLGLLVPLSVYAIGAFLWMRRR